jgi:prevent-host-death family protein
LTIAMTRIVQASAAKTHLLQLLDAVERGETFVITRHGRAVARLEPEAARRQADIDAAVAELRELGRRNGKVAVDDLLSARDQGRRA